MNKSYFETIKIIDSKPLHMPYHQKRYESVLTSLGIKEFENLEDYIKAPEIGLYKCRLVYTPHAISVTYHAYKKREISSLKLIFNNDIEYATKSTSREELDALYAKRDESDDVLIIKNLLVTDTSIANIAFYKNGIRGEERGSTLGVWITPKQPLLKGTTRARLLDAGKIIEADIKVSELRTFSKVALLNAMIDFDILDRCEFLV
ncbi:MAG: aminotransferase class IV [Campylobacterales bacterium]|nr:aminotransferase class IV [Campylobacterales bacterium]